jgi:hypothetical protein
MKPALRVLPGSSQRRVKVVFDKRDGPISDEDVLARMRRAIDVGNHERVLHIEIVRRERDGSSRAFVFEGEALVASRLMV